MRNPDDSLLDLDDITAQISTAKPEVCKSKRVLQGEYCCHEYCNLVKVKLTAYEKEAMEVREMEQAGHDDEEQMTVEQESSREWT